MHRYTIAVAARKRRIQEASSLSPFLSFIQRVSIVRRRDASANRILFNAIIKKESAAIWNKFENIKMEKNLKARILKTRVSGKKETMIPKRFGLRVCATIRVLAR